MKHRLLCLAFSAVFLLGTLVSFAACSQQSAPENTYDNKITIWTGAEDYRNEMFQTELNAHFPDYEITLEYMTTGNMAAKVYAEETASEADILVDVDYGYLSKMNAALADLSAYDTSIYVDDAIDETHKVLPDNRNGGCIAVNTEILAQKGLSEPTCYDDLLKPEYKGLVSMPSPKSSGTGYMFYKSLVNARGETAALEYFDKLSENILQYTSSGSGPVNALVAGEAAIGLAMNAQTVLKINEGAPLKILFFQEGSPYNMYGIGMIEGKQNDPAVKEVFQYFVDVLIPKDKAEFIPEKIYKDVDYVIENYPTDIVYSDMSNNTSEEKTRLLELWTH